MANQVKRDQNRQRELAYMRRVKQTMQPKSTEERQREIEREQAANRQTLSSRAGNVLWRNKGKILVLIFVVFLAAIGIYSWCMRPRFDLKVLAAYAADSLSVEKYETLLSRYGYDTDGNGKVEYQVLDACLSENQGGQAEVANRTSFSAYLQLGDAHLYLLDKAIYEELKAQSETVFVDLSRLFPGAPGVEGDRFLLAESPLAAELDDRSMPNELCFVLRARNEAGMASDSYKRSERILTNLIKGEKTN